MHPLIYRLILYYKHQSKAPRYVDLLPKLKIKYLITYSDGIKRNETKQVRENAFENWKKTEICK